jgi:hypothetical protein
MGSDCFAHRRARPAPRRLTSGRGIEGHILTSTTSRDAANRPGLRENTDDPSPLRRPAARDQDILAVCTRPVPRDTAHGGRWWHPVTQDGV